MSTVIKAENISKQYRLGAVGMSSLSDDFQRFIAKMKGKDDPFQKIGEENARDMKVHSGESDYVWALKDIDFEVQQGEVLGIVGKNGAGKSTLLKILSRVTEPTTGRLSYKGRLASLLEVGTGFHPDLSGRDNIFLNGAILGMKKHEIKSKLDAIVDFSGVARYLDTPVKRYSSGMYVRLAFAVAAHLEPEILIVDEVLAVGDAEFQKKCLGKMKDVSGEGRTVLFVSHNMPSIRMLCDKCLYMEKGKMKSIGATDAIIGQYLADGYQLADASEGVIPGALSMYNTGEAKFRKAYVTNSKSDMVTELDFQEPFKVEVELSAIKDLEQVSLTLFIVNQFGENVLMAVENERYLPADFRQGNYKITIGFDEALMPGNYSIGLNLAYFHTGASIDYVESFYPFTVSKESKLMNLEYPWATVHGYTKPKTNWIIKKI